MSNPNGNPTHGMSKTPTYRAWYHMKERCQNPNNSKYHRYGGRGITVCDEWQTFEGFFKDMGEKPEGTTIDRRDNDCGYFAENCRWATQKAQCNNKENNTIIELHGMKQTLTQWAEMMGIPTSTLYNRLFVLGWDTERALNYNWLTIGKLIEEYEIELYVAVHSCEGDIRWNATYYFETEEEGEPADGYGATPQEAVCKAVIAALGDK